MKKYILIGITVFLTAFYSSCFSQTITPKQAQDYVGKKVTVCGEVSNIFYYERGKGSPTFIDMGGNYPNQEFDVVIWEENRKKFSYDIESLEDSKICVTGRIKEYRGKPEIVVSNPTQINKEK